MECFGISPVFERPSSFKFDVSGGVGLEFSPVITSGSVIDGLSCVAQFSSFVRSPIGVSTSHHTLHPVHFTVDGISFIRDITPVSVDL
jgi:hypothetical protein